MRQLETQTKPEPESIDPSVEKKTGDWIVVTLVDFEERLDIVKARFERAFEEFGAPVTRWLS